MPQCNATTWRARTCDTFKKVHVECVRVRVCLYMIAALYNHHNMRLQSMYFGTRVGAAWVYHVHAERTRTHVWGLQADKFRMR